MVRAFIMVKTTAGDAEPVRNEIAGTEGIEDVHVVAGEYDVIAQAVGEEVYDVIQRVTSSVRDIEGVVDTRTYICLEED